MMGSHANGTIAYGIPLENEEILPNVTDEEWDEILDVWDRDKIKERGYEIVYHGNSQAGYTDYFIALPGSQTHVYAWEPKRLFVAGMLEYPETDPEVFPYDFDAMLEFGATARKLGLDPDLAAWYITVDFG